MAGGTMLFTHEESDLRRVCAPDITAVVLDPQSLPEWFVPLGAAVQSRSLQVVRTVLEDASRDQIRMWLDAEIEISTLGITDLKDAVIADLLHLVDLAALVTGGDRFIFRIFTEAPTRHCGYHVDTVPAGAPPWGILRVYNGAPTTYVDPGSVGSMAEFYRYFNRRERLVREMSGGNNAEAALQELCDLDERSPFVRDVGDVHVVPRSAVVAFTHLDLQEMFADSVRQAPWIHCSPMTGGVRLVANVTSRRGNRRPPQVRGMSDR